MDSSYVLLKRILDATVSKLHKSKSSNAEDRRVKWMNVKIFMMWFDN